jgi:hypothetical protein
MDAPCVYRCSTIGSARQVSDYGIAAASRQMVGTTDEHGLTQMENAGWFILSVFICG